MQIAKLFFLFVVEDTDIEKKVQLAASHPIKVRIRRCVKYLTQ